MKLLPERPVKSLIFLIFGSGGLELSRGLIGVAVKLGVVGNGTAAGLLEILDFSEIIMPLFEFLLA